ncbi:MAG: cysteine desulfurase family protein [Symbiobacterium sp.]|uniref:cysteine desulfurase family protein n=1 Tax=Symbiobacterium sp. TaxID=1971213 RepID=UPI00346406AA
MERTIYLDYNATTPVDPAVVAAMLPYFNEHYGNPHSQHRLGSAAAAALAAAREQVASLIGASPGEVVFTSCASESINLALKGVAFARGRGHIITSGIEHPATLQACRYLEREFGFALTVLPADGQGRVDPDAVRRALRPDTILISLLHAQNETGVIQPVEEVGRIAREAGVLFHVDAAQSCGKIPVSVEAIGCDLLTVAGHKLYAPKGVGALYVRRGVSIHPLIHGADYEEGRRAGTENVPYIVALGRACEIAEMKLVTGEPRRLAELRDWLEAALTEALPVRVTGQGAPRLPNTLHVRFEGLVGNDLLAAAPTVAASTGSACHAGVSEPSAVLLAMGLSPADALGAVRLSLGRPTTREEVEAAATALIDAARRLRAGAWHA